MRALPVTLVAAALLLGGCASLSTPRQRARAAAEVSALAARVQELEGQLAAERATVARLEARLAAVTTPSTGTTATPAPSVALPSPGAAIDVEEINDLGSGATAPASGESTEVQAAYDRAIDLYRDGRRAEAETGLLEFLGRYPSSSLADNAWYWIGAARLARSDVGAAETAFRQLVESYPEGNKLPDALFKLGQCRLAQGDADGARAAWQTLVEEHPESSAAALALARLALVAPSPR